MEQTLKLLKWAEFVKQTVDQEGPLSKVGTEDMMKSGKVQTQAGLASVEAANLTGGR